jgi:serine O-acetyltransferase
LPHPQGIVIGPNTVVGPYSWIYQNVTLGGNSGNAGGPHVGSGARLFTGAVVVGSIVVGDDVVVGANVVVTSSVPSYAKVRSSQSTSVGSYAAPADIG